MTKVLVPVADGVEMVEALAIVDVFRRGGAEVDIASVGEELLFTSSHNVRIYADKMINDCKNDQYDLIAIPGGIPGAEKLAASEVLAGMLKSQSTDGRLYGAICASPAVVLNKHGLLDGKKATCHPMFTSHLPDQGEVASTVVRDGNCVTSRGAGTAVTFGLELLGMLMGEEKKKEVAAGMVLEV